MTIAITTVNTMALFRRFIVERFAAIDDPDFLEAEDLGSPISRNVYTYPPGLPEGFPENRRAILIREVQGPTPGMGQLATARFYVRAYGTEPRDADYVARVLYGTCIHPDGRWRYGWSVGGRFVKWVRFESKPYADVDEGDRAFGFLIADVRLGIV